MKTLLAAVLLFTAASLPAQVPQLLNYQGRVAIRGVNYDGSLGTLDNRHENTVLMILSQSRT